MKFSTLAVLMIGVVLANSVICIGLGMILIFLLNTLLNMNVDYTFFTVYSAASVVFIIRMITR